MFKQNCFRETLCSALFRESLCKLRSVPHKNTTSSTVIHIIVRIRYENFVNKPGKTEGKKIDIPDKMQKHYFPKRFCNGCLIDETNLCK